MHAAKHRQPLPFCCALFNTIISTIMSFVVLWPTHPCCKRHWLGRVWPSSSGVIVLVGQQLVVGRQADAWLKLPRQFVVAPPSIQCVPVRVGGGAGSK